MISKLLAAALGCVVLAGPAWAQHLPGTSSKAAKLSDSQKLEKSAENLERMKGSLRTILQRVEDARAEKDVVKLNCVNEKLAQVKGLIKVAEQADIALHEALTAKDPASDSEFARIGIARTKVDALKGDAEQCIGQLAYIVDEKTTVEVQAPQGMSDASAEASGRRGGRGGHGGAGGSGAPPPPPPPRRPKPASPF